MEEYVILESIDLRESSFSIEDTEKVIDRYLSNPSEYADPILCKEDHFIGKVFIPESNCTIFWCDILDKKYFFDLQVGNV